MYPLPEPTGPLPEPAAPEPGPRVVPSPPLPPSATRLIAGVALGAGLATLGGWILGEYPFTGVMPYLSGVLFALVVAEVIVSVSLQSTRLTAVASAICTVGGLGLGVWISTGRGIDPVPIGGWMALIVGAAVALFRGGIKGAGRSGRSSQRSS